jgi:hypothetical protein
MKNEMNQVQVYCVIAGVDYEGEVFNTLQLFDCKSAAEAYYQELDAQYDYAMIRVQSVNMKSALIAA